MKKYYIALINRIFKILGIYEDKIDFFRMYVNDLCSELKQNTDYSEIIEIRFKLLSLLDDSVDHGYVKRTVFNCIDILDRMLSNWVGD